MTLIKVKIHQTARNLGLITIVVSEFTRKTQIFSRLIKKELHDEVSSYLREY